MRFKDIVFFIIIIILSFWFMPRTINVLVSRSCYSKNLQVSSFTFDAFFSSFSLAESPSRGLEITANK